LAAWSSHSDDHSQSGRIEQADKVEAKVIKLRQLTGRESDSLYVSL
jgi:hypothetical protein